MSVVATDNGRAQMVTAGRKRLKQFRAHRSHTEHPAMPSSASTSPRFTAEGNTPTAPLHSSTLENSVAVHRSRRTPSHTKADMSDYVDGSAAIKFDAPPKRHSRSGSHQRQRSSAFWPPRLSTEASAAPADDLPPLDVFADADSTNTTESSQSMDSLMTPREIVTTPATPPGDISRHELQDDQEQEATERLNAFTFGAKPAPGSRLSPKQLLPPFDMREAQLAHSVAPASRRPPFSARSLKFDIGEMLAGATSQDSLSIPRSSSRPTSPTRKRHSHNRSESISLPNLKLMGRPHSLGMPSTLLPSSPTSPDADAVSRSGRLSAPLPATRLKFEPSEKEKEESRRRALEKLTGNSQRLDEPKTNSIILPSLDDDDDYYSNSSSRPQSSGLASTASSSRPSSYTYGSSGSGSFSGANSPLSWSTFEDTDRCSGGGFNGRFDHAKEESASFSFDLTSTSKTSSVLINSGLGVLAEEDETESDGDDTDPQEKTITSQSKAEDTSSSGGPTPSRLRELHLVSSVSSQGSDRRRSNPDILAALARVQSPTKPYGSLGRGRPRPLALDGGLKSIVVPTVDSPIKGAPRLPRAQGHVLGRPRALSGSRPSSISYKRDDSGGTPSHDAVSQPLSSDPASPTSEWHSQSRAAIRPCPRPRSAIINGGTSGRVLGEVSEAEENDPSSTGPTYDPQDDGVSLGRTSTEMSRDSIDSSSWTSGIAKEPSDGWSVPIHDSWPASRRDSFTGTAGKRDSRDRLDMEMERDALREDVEKWRQRCRGLEDKLEAERRETAQLRERVRKLSDRVVSVSSAHAPSIPSAAEDRELTQSRMITEMRDQLFSLTSALERERREKAEAIARAAQLQTTVDLAQTPQASAASLPTTPKSRPVAGHELTSPPYLATPGSAYADADEATSDGADDETGTDSDPNILRMKGWGFPHGRIDKSDNESKRESFFGLSRPRPVRARPASGSGLGLAWSPEASVGGAGAGFDLPPFLVDESNSTHVVPVSVPHAPAEPTMRTLNGTRPLQMAATRSIVDVLQSRPEMADAHLAPGHSAFTFLSGYLPLPRNSPPKSNVPIPRIAVTPSSASPKRRPLPEEHLLHNPLQHAPVGGGPGQTSCDIDYSHGCKCCSSELIVL